MFSTDGALKTTTIPINTSNNAKDGKPHIGEIQRLELKKEGKQKGRGREFSKDGWRE